MEMMGRSRGARSRSVARLWLGALGFLFIGFAAPDRALAQEAEDDLTVTGKAAEPAPDEVSTDLPPEDVALDRLLQLPTTLTFDPEKRQGTSEAEWRRRFRDRTGEVSAAETALAETRSELEEATGGSGGGQWQMAPPGSNATENSPVSFKLREDIRRGKERVESAERDLRELQVEADLADVPESWREG